MEQSAVTPHDARIDTRRIERRPSCQSAVGVGRGAGEDARMSFWCEPADAPSSGVIAPSLFDFLRTLPSQIRGPTGCMWPAAPSIISKLSSSPYS